MISDICTDYNWLKSLTGGDMLRCYWAILYWFVCCLGCCYSCICWWRHGRAVIWAGWRHFRCTIRRTRWPGSVLLLHLLIQSIDDVIIHPLMCAHLHSITEMFMKLCEFFQSIIQSLYQPHIFWIRCPSLVFCWHLILLYQTLEVEYGRTFTFFLYQTCKLTNITCEWEI